MPDAFRSTPVSDNSLTPITERPRIILEVGTGRGTFTPLFRELGAFSDYYLASDLKKKDLKSASFSDLRDPYNPEQSRLHGVQLLDEINANALENTFQRESIDHIICANPKGDLTTAGASYGLMRSTGNRNDPFLVDIRFASSAHHVLKPRGQARLFGCCNTLVDYLKKTWGHCKRMSPKSVNRFIDIPPEDLPDIAEIGFRVDVFPATPSLFFTRQHPERDVLSFASRDESESMAGEINTEFVLTKTTHGRSGGVFLHDHGDSVIEKMSEKYEAHIQNYS